MKKPTGKHWEFVGAVVEGNKLEIEGMDVWKFEWLRDDNSRAEIKDPNYQRSFSFPIYRIVDSGKIAHFAAGEFSNSVFGFFVPRSCVTND